MLADRAACNVKRSNQMTYHSKACLRSWWRCIKKGFFCCIFKEIYFLLYQKHVTINTFINWFFNVTLFDDICFDDLLMSSKAIHTS
jgi:hypothetical protein